MIIKAKFPIYSFFYENHKGYHKTVYLQTNAGDN